MDAGTFPPVISRIMSVSVGPGQIALTSMPYCFTSAARHSVKLIRAALVGR